MRIAVLFDNFGPYHVARLAAASKVGDLLGIEVSGRSAEYAWNPTREAPGFQRETLLERITSEGQDRGLLAGRMSRVLTAFRPEVVAVPGWSSRAAILALGWCLRERVPAILMSESQAIDEPRHALKEWVKRRCLRAFSAALVGGRTHREYLIQLGMPRDRIFLGYDAVDNEYFMRGAAAARADAIGVRRKLSLPEHYFLASNRFIPKKNLSFLIAAFARYRAECLTTPWDLVLLGDGVLRAEIEPLVVRLGLERSTHSPGFKQYEQLPVYYGLAGAFVHASTTEQWGLVVNEAMASGLPVLVSNRCGCAAELVQEGRNGFTFEPENADQLVRYMLRLSSAPADAEAMGIAGQAIASQWGPERFAGGMREAVACAQAVGPARPDWVAGILLRLLAQRST